MRGEGHFGLACATEASSTAAKPSFMPASLTHGTRRAAAADRLAAAARDPVLTVRELREQAGRPRDRGRIFRVLSVLEREAREPVRVVVLAEALIQRGEDGLEARGGRHHRAHRLAGCG